MRVVCKFCFICYFIVILRCNDVYIDGSTECPCDGSSLYPYKYIKDGIRNSNTNDKVIVKDGIYSGSSNIDISILSTYTVLESVNGALNTIIDCNFTGYGFRIESNSITIKGFTVKNCIGYKYNNMRLGGGFYILSNYLSLIDMNISNNNADYGGGLYIASNSIFIYNSTIHSNTANRGAGAYLESAYMRYDNTSIINNNCNQYGGGIYSISARIDLFNNSNINDNYADNKGNEIYCRESTFNMYNNSYIKNRENSDDLYCRNCRIYGNISNNPECHKPTPSPTLRPTKVPTLRPTLKPINNISPTHGPTNENEALIGGAGLTFGQSILILLPIIIIIIVVCYFCKYNHSEYNSQYKTF